MGIADVVGAVLATRSAAWAFATGLLRCLLIYARDCLRGETDGAFASADAAAKKQQE